MEKEYQYLESMAKKAIDEATQSDACIIMCVDGFISDHEALILKDLLWYARDNGVEVRMVPHKK